jgi:hypothetical protein
MLNILITYNGVEHVEATADVAKGLSEFIKDNYRDLKVRVAPLLHCGSLFENVTKDEYIIYVSLDSPVVLTDACLNNAIYKNLALDGRIYDLTFDTPYPTDYSDTECKLISDVIKAVRKKYVYNRDFRVQKNLLAKKNPYTFSTDPLISLNNSSLGNDYSVSKNVYLDITNDESSFTYVDVLYILDVNNQNILSFGNSLLKKAMLKPNEEFTFALFDLNKIESVFGPQDIYKLSVCYRINDNEYLKEFIID